MIQNLKDLDKFFKLCRKQGVTEINCGGVAVKFGDLPQNSGDLVSDDEVIPTDELQGDDLIFYATRDVERQSQ